MRFLGVDGGNTKTLAVVADTDGTIVGAARGGCSDLYGAVSEQAALTEIEDVVLAALAGAGVAADTISCAVLSLAGADWSEDHDLYRSELRARLELPEVPIVVNDAFGGLWAGSPGGVGVSVVCGTAGAVGGRGRDGRSWHASFWLGSSGAVELVRSAVRCVSRATCGIDEPTSLTTVLPAFFDVPSADAMLHRLTRRGSDVGMTQLASAAPAVLDAADSGDATARRLVAECGTQLGDFALVAAREVDLVDGSRPFPLVLSGGVLQHPSPLLARAIVGRVAAAAPGVRPTRAGLPPVAGAVLFAMHEDGIATDGTVVQRLTASLQCFEAIVESRGTRGTWLGDQAQDQTGQSDAS